MRATGDFVSSLLINMQTTKKFMCTNMVLSTHLQRTPEPKSVLGSTVAMYCSLLYLTISLMVSEWQIRWFYILLSPFDSQFKIALAFKLCDKPKAPVRY